MESTKNYKLNKVGDDDFIDIVEHFNYNTEAIDNILSKKVNAEEGKTLTDNNFTDELKEKLEQASQKEHTHNYAGSRSPGGAANNALLLGNNIMDYRRLFTVSSNVGDGENGFVALVAGGINYGEATNVGFGILEVTSRGGVSAKYTRLTTSNIRFGYVDNGDGTTSIWIHKGVYCHNIHLLALFRSGITINNDSESIIEPTGITWTSNIDFIDGDNYKNYCTAQNIQVADTNGNYTSVNLEGVLQELAQNSPLPRGIIGEQTNWNTIIQSGTYQVGMGTINENQNYPGANGVNAYQWGILLVFNKENLILQVYYPHNKYDGMWFRVRYAATEDGWQEWTNISYLAERITVSDTAGNYTSNILENILSEIGTNKPNYWTGTQAQYNALTVKSANTIYLITG